MLTVGLEDIWARLDVYSNYLPKQARWEAELLIDELMSGNEVGAAHPTKESSCSTTKAKPSYAAWRFFGLRPQNDMPDALI